MAALMVYTVKCYGNPPYCNARNDQSGGCEKRQARIEGTQHVSSERPFEKYQAADRHHSRADEACHDQPSACGLITSCPQHEGENRSSASAIKVEKVIFVLGTVG